MPFFLILASCMDYGEHVNGLYKVNDCFQYKGQSYKVIEVMNKNYKYLDLKNQNELVYPINSIDLESQKTSC